MTQGNRVIDNEHAAEILSAQLAIHQSVAEGRDEPNSEKVRITQLDRRRHLRLLYENLPKWKIEVCYFGGPVWPSEATYRTHGARVQRRVDVAGASDKELPDGIASQHSLYREATQILSRCDDVTLQVSEKGVVRLYGWLELTTVKQLELYIKDKNDSM